MHIQYTHTLQKIESQLVNHDPLMYKCEITFDFTDLSYTISMEFTVHEKIDENMYSFLK